MSGRPVVFSLVLAMSLLLGLSGGPVGAYPDLPEVTAQPQFEVAMTPEVSMDADFIFVCCGEGWRTDPSVSVTVFDAPGGTILFGPYSVPTDAEGSFEIGPGAHGLDLVPGMYVVVTGDTTGITKELTLSELTFEDLDAETDTASGTAPAGSEVAIEAGLPDSDGFFCCLWDVADESGNWYVDFGAEGFDVTGQMGGTVHLPDEDGDTTRAGIPAPGGPQYQFSGFFRPVDSRPTVNLVKAGQAIPVKFSLGEDFGLDIFAPDSPSSGWFACGDPSLDPIEWTASASNAGLTYDAVTGQYTYVWKTSKAWAGTCRRLFLEFNDGSVQTADFQFTR
ncbi:MAG: PxKF domain-containing protein [Chloroflexota bacterium]